MENREWEICQNLAVSLVAKKTSTFVVITSNPFNGGCNSGHFDRWREKAVDHGMVNCFFAPQEAELIKSLPLAQVESEDINFGLGRGMEVTHVNPDIVSLRKRQSW